MKCRKVLLLVTLVPLLSSCSWKWSWWSSNSSEIKKGVTKEEMEVIYNDAYKHVIDLTGYSRAESMSSYNKDYASTFTTDEFNIEDSSVLTKIKYSNDIIVSNSTSTREEYYQNATAIEKLELKGWLYWNNKGFLNKTIGVFNDTYKSETTTETDINTLTEEEIYERKCLITLPIFDDILEKDYTFGMNNDDQYVVEFQDYRSSTIEVNGTKCIIPTFENVYTRYTFAHRVDDKNISNNYYYLVKEEYSSIEKTSFDIFNEPLSSAYLLNEYKVKTSYVVEDYGPFDYNLIGH